jgi:hypothetical protein
MQFEKIPLSGKKSVIALSSDIAVRRPFRYIPLISDTRVPNDVAMCRYDAITALQYKTGRHGRVP